jgi:hypothetical protein
MYFHLLEHLLETENHLFHLHVPYNISYWEHLQIILLNDIERHAVVHSLLDTA